MYEIIVATHGKLSEGFRDTIDMVMGERKGLYFIEFSQNDEIENLREKFINITNSIKDENEILILTDLFGGTPCNTAIKIALESELRIKILSGVNLPMLIEAVLNQDSILDEVIESILSSSKQGIMNIDLNSQVSIEDE
ncbi:MAG: PTS sugar transporter subunit IIA [Clostridium sp.]|uniref:PTS sugar transporter subunit IIA n=1 Tax=Clostridium sp. TaxID=1506 RepID=UPI002912894D|nr:PTS sugar transporter subunit IIA [Clostridium sp.]MDU5111037.1 PTS sugar transporter subunit IIA [Clostridium sp.]